MNAALHVMSAPSRFKRQTRAPLAAQDGFRQLGQVYVQLVRLENMPIGLPIPADPVLTNTTPSQERMYVQRAIQDKLAVSELKEQDLV